MEKVDYEGYVSISLICNNYLLTASHLIMEGLIGSAYCPLTQAEVAVVSRSPGLFSASFTPLVQLVINVYATYHFSLSILYWSSTQILKVSGFSLSPFFT